MTDVLLDTSWSIQYIPATEQDWPILLSLLKRNKNPSKRLHFFQQLSHECENYLRSRGPVSQDELNDESERTGSLRECTISQLQLHSALPADAFDSDVSGLLIQTNYEKTSCQIVLLGRIDVGDSRCPFSTLLYKGAQNHVKYVKDFLDSKIGVPIAFPLRLPPEVLLQIVSRYLATLTSSRQANTGYTDALWQAMLEQVIGNMKTTITFATASGIAPKLKTMDLDLPSETTNALLTRAEQQSVTNSRAPEHTFLDELAKAIHEKTGLILPLGLKFPTASSGSGETTTLTPTAESPLKITRVVCAAFAIGAEGKVKLASKPIENAEVIGYNESVVRKAHAGVIDMIRAAAESRRQAHDG